MSIRILILITLAFITFAGFAEITKAGIPKQDSYSGQYHFFTTYTGSLAVHHHGRLSDVEVQKVVNSPMFRKTAEDYPLTHSFLLAINNAPANSSSGLDYLAVCKNNSQPGTTAFEYIAINPAPSQNTYPLSWPVDKTCSQIGFTDGGPYYFDQIPAIYQLFLDQLYLIEITRLDDEHKDSPTPLTAIGSDLKSRLSGSSGGTGSDGYDHKPYKGFGGAKFQDFFVIGLLQNRESYSTEITGDNGTPALRLSESVDESHVIAVITDGNGQYFTKTYEREKIEELVGRPIDTDTLPEVLHISTTDFFNIDDDTTDLIITKRYNLHLNLSHYGPKTVPHGHGKDKNKSSGASSDDSSTGFISFAFKKGKKEQGTNGDNNGRGEEQTGFICEICKKAFLTQKALKTHNLDAHQAEDILTITIPEILDGLFMQGSFSFAWIYKYLSPLLAGADVAKFAADFYNAIEAREAGYSGGAIESINRIISVLDGHVISADSSSKILLRALVALSTERDEQKKKAGQDIITGISDADCIKQLTATKMPTFRFHGSNSLENLINKLQILDFLLSQDKDFQLEATSLKDLLQQIIINLTKTGALPGSQFSLHRTLADSINQNIEPNTLKKIIVILNEKKDQPLNGTLFFAGLFTLSQTRYPELYRFLKNFIDEARTEIPQYLTTDNEYTEFQGNLHHFLLTTTESYWPLSTPDTTESSPTPLNPPTKDLQPDPQSLPTIPPPTSPVLTSLPSQPASENPGKNEDEDEVKIKPSSEAPTDNFVLVAAMASEDSSDDTGSDEEFTIPTAEELYNVLRGLKSPRDTQCHKKNIHYKPFGHFSQFMCEINYAHACTVENQAMEKVGWQLDYSIPAHQNYYSSLMNGFFIANYSAKEAVDLLLYKDFGAEADDIKVQVATNWIKEIIESHKSAFTRALTSDSSILQKILEKHGLADTEGYDCYSGYSKFIGQIFQPELGYPFFQSVLIDWYEKTSNQTALAVLNLLITEITAPLSATGLLPIEIRTQQIPEPAELPKHTNPYTNSLTSLQTEDILRGLMSLDKYKKQVIPAKVSLMRGEGVLFTIQQCKVVLTEYYRYQYELPPPPIPSSFLFAKLNDKNVTLSQYFSFAKKHKEAVNEVTYYLSLHVITEFGKEIFQKYRAYHLSILASHQDDIKFLIKEHKLYRYLEQLDQVSSPIELDMIIAEILEVRGFPQWLMILEKTRESISGDRTPVLMLCSHIYRDMMNPGQFVPTVSADPYIFPQVFKVKAKALRRK